MMREDRKRAEQRQKKIARRKREVQRMKRKLYKAGIFAAAGIIVLAVILMLCGSGNAKKSAKKTSSAKTKTETETKTPEEIEAEKVQEVLDSDQYKDQLGELYKKNPETKEIILNREKYSDDLLTWLFDHQEALQWVIDYPEQSARSEEELSAQGLQAVDLKDYRIQNHIPVYFQWSEVWGYASYGSENIGMGGCGRASGRSILLIHTITGSFSARAFFKTNLVCGMAPSKASTRRTTPLTILRTRSTSPPKSACPGVSMILIFVFL